MLRSYLCIGVEIDHVLQQSHSHSLGSWNQIHQIAVFLLPLLHHTQHLTIHIAADALKHSPLIAGNQCGYCAQQQNNLELVGQPHLQAQTRAFLQNVQALCSNYCLQEQLHFQEKRS